MTTNLPGERFMTDESGKVQNHTESQLASTQTSHDVSPDVPPSDTEADLTDLHATIAALQAENQHLKTELAAAQRSAFSTSLPQSAIAPSDPVSQSCPDETNAVPDAMLPKPLVQQNLYDFLDQFTVGCAQANLVTGQYAFVNQAFCDMLGYSRTELLAMSFYDISHPDECAHNQSIVQQHLDQTQPTYSLEKRYLHKDGHYIWAYVTVMSVRLPGGKCSPLGIIRDITSLKKAEALQQAYLQDLNTWRSRYEMASQASSQILYEWNLETNVAIFGSNTSQILGYPAAELPTTVIGWFQLAHPHDRQQLQQKVDTPFQPERMLRFDYRLRHRNGYYIWVEDNCQFATDGPNSRQRLIGAIHDISDRKRIEEELRRSREMLQAVMDNVPQRIFWKDINSIYLGCNQPQAAAAGLARPEQIIGLHDRDLPWTPSQTQAYSADDDLVMQSNQPLRNVLEVQRQSNGQMRWLECHKIPLHDAHGQVIGLVGTAEDITERKQAEDLLIQHAKRERALNQVVYAIRNSLNLPDIFSTAVREVGRFLNLDWVKIVRYEPTRQVWRVVEAFQRVHLGEVCREVVGMEIPDADNPFSARLKQGQIVQQHDASTCEDTINQELSTVFPGGWLLAPIRLAEQTWGCLTLIRSEQPLQWSKADVGVAQALADQLAIAIQQSELYQQVNQLNVTLEQQVQSRTAQLQRAIHFEALLKRITDRVRDSLNESQILNTVVKELVHGLGALSCDSGRYDLEAQTSTIAYECVDATSSFAPLDNSVCPMAYFPRIYSELLAGESLQFCWLPQSNPLRPSNQSFTALACPLIDDQSVIGDLWLYRESNDSFDEMEVRLAQQVANQCAIAVRQARLYQAAQAQVSELARLNQLKDDFLSTVSHELRTPMSSIQMSVQMLEISFQKMGIQMVTPHPIYTYLHILQAECNREISLINDLLDLSRLEAEVEPLELTAIELHLWLSHIAEPFLERTRLQKQQFQLELPTSLPIIVTDLSYLERAITELLHNACKYTPPGETITIAAHTHEAGIQIDVMNTGVTIADAECDRIFDKFYRIPNGDPWKHGGTGLGLALVKKLVERIDGSILLNNPPNQVIFTIHLPLQHRQARLEQSQSQSQFQSQFQNQSQSQEQNQTQEQEQNQASDKWELCDRSL